MSYSFNIWELQDWNLSTILKQDDIIWAMNAA